MPDAVTTLPEGMTLEQIMSLLTVNDGETIIPLKVKREDVHKIVAVKLTDAEKIKVQNFQEYLFARGYLPEDTFAQMFAYVFNVAYTLHEKVAKQEAKQEAVG